MKTPEEILEEVMSESPYKANFNISKPYILKAIENYSIHFLKNFVKHYNDSVDGLEYHPKIENSSMYEYLEIISNNKNSKNHDK